MERLKLITDQAHEALQKVYDGIPEPLRDAGQATFSGFDVKRAEVIKDMRTYLGEGHQGAYTDTDLHDAWWFIASYERAAALMSRLACYLPEDVVGGEAKLTEQPAIADPEE